MRFLAAGVGLLVAFGALTAVVEGCGSSSASPTADAGADVYGTRGPDATGPPTTWCDQKPHAFCADFDGAELTRGWAQAQPDMDSFEASPSDRSPPNALHLFGAGAPNKYNTFGGASLLAKFSAANAQAIRVALDVQLDATTALDDQYGLELVSFLAQDPAAPSTHQTIAGLKVYASKSTLYVDDLGGDAAFSPARQVDAMAFPAGRWVHVELSLVATASEIGVTMTFDGTTAAQGSVASGSFTTGDFELEVSGFRGGQGVAAFGPVSLHFDDLTVDVE